MKNLLLLLMLIPSISFSQYSDQEIRAAIKKAGGPELFIQKMARDGASNLPMRLNKNTEMQSVVSSGLNLMYSIQLINIEKTPALNINELKKNVNYAPCSSNVIGYLIREHNARISYSYTARGSEFLFQHDLDRKSCLGK